MSGLPELCDLREMVVRAADSTGLSSFGLHATEAKGDGSLVTAFDHQIQALILSELKASWPQFSFLGEEMEHGEQSPREDWCLTKDTWHVLQIGGSIGASVWQ